MKKLLSLLLTLAIVAGIAVAGGCALLPDGKGASAADSAQLSVYYLDVGQGDCEFAQLPDGRTLLIDAGESESSDNIISYLKELGCTRLDYVIATHPHADHIGGMKAVIEAFDVGEIYMPRASANTKTYEKLLTAISEKGLKINTAKAGTQLLSDGELTASFLAPCSDSYDELNDYSAVLRLSYRQRNFLFMGDAETLSENEITADVTCDVIKVGHHGSTTSSGGEFVRRTHAKYAIIEVGAGNSYHHPSDAVVARWESAGARVLRTDQNGTVTARTDGSSLTVTPEKQAS